MRKPNGMGIHTSVLLANPISKPQSYLKRIAGKEEILFLYLEDLDATVFRVSQVIPRCLITILSVLRIMSVND